MVAKSHNRHAARQYVLGRLKDLKYGPPEALRPRKKEKKTLQLDFLTLLLVAAATFGAMAWALTLVTN